MHISIENNRACRQVEMRPSVLRLLQLLQSNSLVALGDVSMWPKNDLRHSVPSDMTMEEAKAVVTNAFRSKRLRLATLRGTMIRGSSIQTHSEMLKHIAHELPNSNVLCLNLGEWNKADRQSYTELVNSLPHSDIGHLYWDSAPDPMGNTNLKATAMHHIRQNRTKDSYRIATVHPEVLPFMKVGCKAWWNLQPSRTMGGVFKKGIVEVTHEMLGNKEPTDRCKQRCITNRCHALNKQKKRCCLCVRPPHRYCHHHRRGAL